MTNKDKAIMRHALPIINAIPPAQNECWPGDGGHDDNCQRTNHDASRAAVEATEGLTWDFYSWQETADWFRAELSK
jgi:hypothetical protein